MPNDGGPAFPREDYQGNGRPGEPLGQQGMSLRDYFAAAAMQGFMSGPSMEVAEKVARAETIDVQTLIVRSAYQIADAMLEERTRTSSRS
jgi:fructose 1,6-bisphosphatase